MIHEGRDDSSFLVPWSVWSPKQMTFIRGWTAGVRAPRLDTRNERKTRGEEWGRALQSVHICFCNTAAWLMNCFGVKEPRALEGHVHTDVSGFSCSIFLPLLDRNIWFLCIDLFKLIDLYFQLWNLFWHMMWSNHRTLCSNTTFIPNLLDFTKLDHCPVDLAWVWLAAADVAVAPGLGDGGVWAGFHFLKSLILFLTFFFILWLTNVTEM